MEKSIQDLQVKVAFLERHLEEMDNAFVEVNDQLRTLSKTVERLAAQQKNPGPGGEESGEDAVPPHY